MRTTASALVAGAAALLLPLTAGCSAVQTALDCGQLAVDVTNDVQQLQQALSNAGDSPQDAQNALNTLSNDLDKLSDKTSNADLSKAVGDLRTQVDKTGDQLDAGKVPSADPLVDAAGKISKVCTGD
ncbi:hypothetical protein [Wenjunlia tyrosinilytica]|nr:hypothetical protein [Wenjunlia tyrosinilytica]